MANRTILKLPLIDFSNLKQEPQAWESTKTRVRKALEEYGCFEAKFDEIPLHLRKSIFDALKQLFDLPLENKLLNTSNKPYHAYLGQDAMVPLYESMGIDNALAPESIETFSNLMWAHGNPTFSQIVESYVEKLSELDKIVRRMVVESFGLEKYMDEHMESTNYVIRVQKYDAPKSHENNNNNVLGFPSHTDKNIVSILFQNEVNGLEMQTKTGHWITKDQLSPNSFVVMIGESLHAWTNGWLHSPHHRVMMAGDKERYSIGLFSVPKSGYIIKAPEEVVDEEHPLLFKPYEYFQFLDFHLEAGRLATPVDLKAYCGA
ncbi:hypothetical protein ABFS82_09G098400 [Erythranthe guttata]|nr:PREDICTED: probable 2-oxoglutarate-dependent dioxygenase AOP1 [Erythranthe guttata]|eukprot:XP_012856495.1 PREDICTED: probable 2-oxoglutarate-dependent dioxygenase AOP1 [Erythranthe guttata]